MSSSPSQVGIGCCGRIRRQAMAASFCWLLVAMLGCGHDSAPSRYPAKQPGADGVFHVRAGESIQAALEAAAASRDHKTVRVHAGTYRPERHGQALIWLNDRHDGITLEAEGQVILTAANEAIADKSAASYPAVVNHVVYFGDGISPRTVLRGFKITGANHFVTRSEKPEPIQPEIQLSDLRKELFFYADGGGIKIFGRSYPTIVNVEVYDNYTSPCGGGVSVEHRGFNEQAATFRNCIFRNNRCQITGSAVDVLPGSSAVIENCLFVGNLSNLGVDYVSPPQNPYNHVHGSGALTVFGGSRVHVSHCTFTKNWNGADDQGMGNIYEHCIFWMNNASGGISPGGRYELDILDGRGVSNCFLAGDQSDLRGTIDPSENNLTAPDPEFDSDFTPRASVYQNVGYRPVAR